MLHVPERVIPPRLEHRTPQRPLVPEPAPLRDPARRPKPGLVHENGFWLNFCDAFTLSDG
ncbi:hypothetical protein FB157_1455 [Streptomyces sp. BK340]|nr:hypothetical protein FB157_1455 [Streptomyces sp. BK340]